MLHWLEQLQNIQRELHQHSWEHFKRARCINPACPLSWVCDHSIFSCTNKTRSFNQYAENMVSTLKHRIITERNNESSTEMTINYIHVYAYTILNHIQYRYTTRTPHERHGIPNTGNLTFCNSMTWLTAKETYVHSPIPEEINCDIVPQFLWNHLYAVLSKIWQERRV